jgi:hypothetical protein
VVVLAGQIVRQIDVGGIVTEMVGRIVIGSRLDTYSRPFRKSAGGSSSIFPFFTVPK